MIPTVKPSISKTLVASFETSETKDATGELHTLMTVDVPGSGSVTKDAPVSNVLSRGRREGDLFHSTKNQKVRFGPEIWNLPTKDRPSSRPSSFSHNERKLKHK